MEIFQYLKLNNIGNIYIKARYIVKTVLEGKWIDLKTYIRRKAKS